jgi:hypothetical protein
VTGADSDGRINSCMHKPNIMTIISLGACLCVRGSEGRDVLRITRPKRKWKLLPLAQADKEREIAESKGPACNTCKAVTQWSEALGKWECLRCGDGVGDAQCKD